MRLINDSMILVAIELDKHTHLRDPRVVSEAMEDFRSQYENLHSWSARVAGNWLFIQASGILTRTDIVL
jgi:hypothetical protein